MGCDSEIQGQVLGVSFLYRAAPSISPTDTDSAPGRTQEPEKMVAPSELEHSMEKMLLTFHKFAGEKNYMNRDDLQKLLDSEFSEFLKNQNDPLAVDKIMKDLDDCRDGRVSFHSFFSLIAGLLCACDDYYVKHMKV
ncbi:hypothetical protein XELAEV_18040838mg [Xenopus laevis]|uniref:Protein S100-A10 n=2 Tax=Xenopus laevis TaxID=8355 RepID=A0A974H970_XENLA|nr:hypothetical protein XELAEV_18040838mg [Xenopus laevis]